MCIREGWGRERVFRKLNGTGGAWTFGDGGGVFLEKEDASTGGGGATAKL